MQYLLNAEEMEDIRDLRQLIYDKLPSRNLKRHLTALEITCKRVATTMAMPDGTKHGCIYTAAVACSYCSGCPVEDICPMPKSYSK